MTLNSKYVSK